MLIFWSENITISIGGGWVIAMKKALQKDPKAE
jgi:hypothetical protein